METEQGPFSVESSSRDGFHRAVRRLEQAVVAAGHVIAGDRAATVEFLTTVRENASTLAGGGGRILGMDVSGHATIRGPAQTVGRWLGENDVGDGFLVEYARLLVEDPWDPKAWVEGLRASMEAETVAAKTGRRGNPGGAAARSAPGACSTAVCSCPCPTATGSRAAHRRRGGRRPTPPPPTRPTPYERWHGVHAAIQGCAWVDRAAAEAADYSGQAAAYLTLDVELAVAAALAVDASFSRRADPVFDAERAAIRTAARAAARALGYLRYWVNVASRAATAAGNAALDAHRYCPPYTGGTPPDLAHVPEYTHNVDVDLVKATHAADQALTARDRAALLQGMALHYAGQVTAPSGYEDTIIALAQTLGGVELGKADQALIDVNTCAEEAATALAEIEALLSDAATDATTPEAETDLATLYDLRARAARASLAAHEQIGVVVGLVNLAYGQKGTVESPSTAGDAVRAATLLELYAEGAVSEAAIACRRRDEVDQALADALDLEEEIDEEEYAASHTFTDSLWGEHHNEITAAWDSIELIPIGLNAPRLYAYESTGDPRHADLDTLLADLDDGDGTEAMQGLGAGYIRMPTDMNISWPQRVKVPVFNPSITRGDVTRDSLYWAMYDALWTPLSDTFSRLGLTAGKHPIRVVLDWLSIASTDGSLVDPRDEYKTGHIVPLVWEDAGTTLNPSHDGKFVAWRDETGEVDATVTLYDQAFSPNDQSVLSSTAGSAERAFAFASLDPRSRYKLYYFYLIGRATAQLLLDLRAALATDTFDLFDHILAIELSNELNAANVGWTDTEVSRDGHTALGEAVQAGLWARVAREGARGLLEVLESPTLNPDGRRPGLWLPSIAAFYKMEDGLDSDGDEPSFTDTEAWQLELLERLLSGFDSPERPAPDASDDSWEVLEFTAADAPTTFSNQDYHHYHYTENGAPGNIARLRAELRKLRDNLDGVGLTDVTLSMSETGASVEASAGVSTETSIDHAGGLPDHVGVAFYKVYDPSGAHFGGKTTAFSYLYDVFTNSPPTFGATVARFQAQEVWRRVLMGLSATTAVAWHTHRDLADSQYVGTGLRNDVGDLSTRPGGAHRHLAWWAFQRVTRFLVVPADATTGRFAGAPPATLLTGLDSPEYPVLETYYYQAPRGTVTSSEAEDTCFVFGLSPGTVADWVYVVILDPTTDKDVAARIIVSNPNGATVWQLPSVPQRVDEVTPADDSDFPQDTPSAEWNEIIQGWSPATTAFELILPSRAGEAAGDPILLLSSEQLFFSIEKTSYP